MHKANNLRHKTISIFKYWSFLVYCQHGMNVQHRTGSFRQTCATVVLETMELITIRKKCVVDTYLIYNHQSLYTDHCEPANRLWTKIKLASTCETRIGPLIQVQVGIPFGWDTRMNQSQFNGIKIHEVSHFFSLSINQVIENPLWTNLAPIMILWSGLTETYNETKLKTNKQKVQWNCLKNQDVCLCSARVPRHKTALSTTVKILKQSSTSLEVSANNALNQFKSHKPLRPVRCNPLRVKSPSASAHTCPEW